MLFVNRLFYYPKAERFVTFCHFSDFFIDRKIRIPDKFSVMFPFPFLCFFLATFFSLTLGDALAEPAPTLPSDIGAALWLKADDAKGGNGTVVTEWKCRVSGSNATQIANVDVKVRKQTTLNNKAAIFFPTSPADNSYRYFEFPSNFNLKNSTVLISLKYEGSAVFPQVLSFLSGEQVDQRDSNNNLIGSIIQINDNPGNHNDALGLYHNGDKFELTSNGTISQSPTYTKGDWTTLSYRIDGNGNMTVSLNGVPGNQTSKPNMAPQNTAGKIHIGLSGKSRRTDKESLDNAYIYEIIIFNKYLDGVEYQEVQRYMQASMAATSVQIVSPPTASPISRGELLSQSILTGGSATSNGMAVTGKFQWSDGSIAITQSGNYSAIFVPDSAIFYSSDEVNVRVEVKPELNSSTGSLTGFRTLNGTASPIQSVSINGTNLTSPNVTVTTDGAEGFEISKDPMGNFTTRIDLPVTSGTVSTPLYVRLAASATIGNKPSRLSIGSSGIFTSVTLSGDVIDSSLSYISVTPEVLAGFVTTAGTPSASANFTVNAYYLLGNLTVNATAGFEISLGNGPFSQSLEIPLSGGNVTNAPLNLRVASSASAGPLLGSVTLASGNKTATLSANGTVAPRPVLSVTPEVLAGFVTTAGTPSTSANFTVNAANLSGNLTANATTGFEISLGNGPFSQSLEIPLSGGNVTNAPLNLRVASSANAGPLLGSVTLRSGNKTATLAANGTVAHRPVLSVTPELLAGFATTAGTPSASANFTVNASNLSGNLTANATTGFEISLGNGPFSQSLEIPLSGGNVTNAPLNLRVASSANAGRLLGSVTLASGNTTATLSANGTVAPRPVFYPTPASEQQNPEISKPGKKIKKPKIKKPKIKKKPKKDKNSVFIFPQKDKNDLFTFPQGANSEFTFPQKDKNSVFTFPQAAATSGSTWITPDGKVVSESQRSQSSNSK